MKKERWFLIFLIVLIFGVTFFEPTVGFRVRNFINGFDDSVISENLKIENQALRAEIQRLKALEFQADGGGELLLTPVPVFSRYPFNFKDELLVEAGEGEADLGQAVVFRTLLNDSFDRLLLGRVEKIFSNTALVVTIFDTDWQSAVRVGGKGYLALFKGGNEPFVSLIPRGADVEPGDLVYNVQEGLPHSLPIGVLGDITMSSDQVFKEAKVLLPYDFGDIEAVAIIKEGQ